MVYPRVCGGTEAAFAPIFRSMGLSPRVRGNQGPPDPHRMGSGSIPACAGEPPSGPESGYSKRVYPRVCGGT